MAKFNIGDKVRIKNISDWPTPPGFRFAGAEGIVVASDFDELMDEFMPHMVNVRLTKAENAKEYVVDSGFWFPTDIVEKK